MSMLTTPVLVLNRVFLPFYITTAKHAFGLMFKGAAKAVNDDFVTHDFDSWASTPLKGGDLAIGTSSTKIKVPRIIQLVNLDKPPKYEVRFSKKNVYLRDGHRCQYCGAVGDDVYLNLDHVLPSSRGGKTTWDNVVTSCIGCNDKKGNRLPKECGMKLRKPPQRPDWHPARLATNLQGAHDSWNTFLFKATA